MSGLYVHIPFCVSRCIYCGFYSITSRLSADNYIEALQHELALRKDYLSSPINTIYIGGGTPSSLSNRQTERLFDVVMSFVETHNQRFQLEGESKEANNEELEITIECNPNDLDDAKIATLSRLLVNRLSMGVQSFNDKYLNFLRRRHSSQEAKNVFAKLRTAGFQNISIDLMFGFPEQSVDDLRRDVDEVVALRPEHVSIYNLMIEENTMLKKLIDEGKVKELNEETSLEMFELICKKMEKAGYEHYEISNFCTENHRSRHNSSYWKDIEYMGIGASAHSFSGRSRQWNVADTEQYIKEIGKNRIPCEVEIIDTTTHFNDIITTATRTSDGINLDYIRLHFGEKYFSHLKNEAQRHIDNETMKIESNALKLTKKGIFTSDMIMTDLIYIEPKKVIRQEK